jgi:muconate cycloisomerase
MSRAVIEIAEPVERVQAHAKDTAIRSIRATIVEAPTRRRHKLSNTEVTHQGYVLVRVLLDNGVTGIGEASTLGGPRWAEESVESIKAAVTNYLGPALLGQPALAFEANALRMGKGRDPQFRGQGRHRVRPARRRRQDARPPRQRACSAAPYASASR